jgi:hypothetical protein
VVDVEIRLRQHKKNTGLEELEIFKTFIDKSKQRCNKLDKLFANHLSEGADSQAERIIKGLESLCKDDEVSDITDSMTDDVAFLNLHRVKPGASIVPGAIPTSQPMKGTY